MVPVDEEPLCGQAITITITNITISYYKLLQAMWAITSLFIIYIFYTMKENFLLTNKN